MMQSVNNNVYVTPNKKHAAALKVGKQAKSATKSKSKTKLTLAPSISPNTNSYEDPTSLNVLPSNHILASTNTISGKRATTATKSNGSKTRGRDPLTGLPEDLSKLTPEEKRQRRLLRNRLAAKECRRKKKLHIMNLEEQFRVLTAENERLEFLKKECEVTLFLASLLTQANAERAAKKKAEELAASADNLNC